MANELPEAHAQRLTPPAITREVLAVLHEKLVFSALLPEPKPRTRWDQFIWWRDKQRERLAQWIAPWVEGQY